MTDRRGELQRKIDACFGLYRKYGGQRHDLIEAEMREKGWGRFSRRNLYARTSSRGTLPGWIERFGWRPRKDKGEKIKEKVRRRGAGYACRRVRSSKVRSSKVRSSSFSLSSSAAEEQAKACTLNGAQACTPNGRKCNRQKMRRLRKRRLRDARSRGIAPNDYLRPFGKAQPFRSASGTAATPNPEPRTPNAPSHDSGLPTPDSEDFHAWLKTLPGGWHWDWEYQQYIYERLKRVTDGTCRRLMIFLPPRHGKSELAAVRYPAWRLKRDPTLNIILASHSQRLANRFSRKIKRVLADDASLGSEFQVPGSELRKRSDPQRMARNQSSGAENEKPQTRNSELGTRNPQPMFPFISQRPANSMAEWETAAGGGLRSVGVGSGVAGYGAHLVVIDDPVKNRAQANSETFRDAMYSWYMDDIYTRLEPNGAIILIQTRWHEDDLAGRLIRDMASGGDRWEIVSLPALAEDSNVQSSSFSLSSSETKEQAKACTLNRKPGQALCPDRYDEDALDQTRRNLGSWSFAALYQQRPAPAEGGTFKRAWFKNIVERAPQGLEWKRGTDLAVSTKTTADYTASFRCAFDRDGNLYIDGGFRRRIEFPEQRRYLIERICEETDTEHGIEEALHGRAFIQDLRRDERLRGRKFKGVKVEGDKLARALSWQNLAEEGRLRLVRGPWNRDFIEEACQFPHGHHDDQIDAVSLAVSMFQQKHGTYGF